MNKNVMKKPTKAQIMKRKRRGQNIHLQNEMRRKKKSLTQRLKEKGLESRSVYTSLSLSLNLTNRHDAFFRMLKNLKPVHEKAFQRYVNYILCEKVTASKVDYTQQHHIYPVAFPHGEKYISKFNLVHLPYYYHLMAHDALASAFQGHEDSMIVNKVNSAYIGVLAFFDHYINTPEIQKLKKKDIQRIFERANLREREMRSH